MGTCPSTRQELIAVSTVHILIRLELFYSKIVPLIYEAMETFQKKKEGAVYHDRSVVL